jgi:hypothetical protein
MFRISEGQYALGGLTVLAVWVFVILPLANHSGTHNMLDAAVKIAPLISAVIVSLSLPTSLAVAVYTIYRNHKIQQSLKAQDLWSTYLQKAIEYPALAYPAGCAKRFDSKPEQYSMQKINQTRTNLNDTNGLFRTCSSLLKRFCSIFRMTTFG